MVVEGVPGGVEHTARPSESGRDGRVVRRALAAAAIGVLGVASVVVLASRVAQTSSARVAATTSTDGRLGAGTIVLRRADASTGLMFDASNLSPGRAVSGCTVLVYDGDVPARLRMTGTITGGSGLADFVRLRLVTRPGDNCDDAVKDDDTLPDDAVPFFAGTLAEFAVDHSGGADGVAVADVEPGDSIVIDSSATIVDDPAAAGLDTGFEFVIEAIAS